MNFFENIGNELLLLDNKIYMQTEKKHSFFEGSLGNCSKLKAFTAIYREWVYFQKVKTGTKISDIPAETQWLLLKYEDDTYTIIVPLVDEPFRSALRGENQELHIYCESGDDAIEGNRSLMAVYANGQNPYKMMEELSKEVCKLIPDCRRRESKKVPEFVNYFGWCTWDSFYDKVSAADVEAGLKNFKDGGFVPGLVILDDGWQSVECVDDDRGKHQLSSFEPNEKFNHNLSETIRSAKEEYGVKLFMVWHAVMGYWGGVYPNSPSMSGFDVKLKTQSYSKIMKEINPKVSEALSFPYGIVNPAKAFEFYNSYHRYLRTQGVDGVKVDVQSSLEGLGYGDGGRVTTIKAFRQGLEASVNTNFDGNLINCMSCANDHILNTLSTNVMRSSDDFFPDIPESHGVHIYRNAFNSIFMGEFVLCDWDMFQTKHKFGGFHAASRAISGSPIYVSDKVDEHDFEIIDKLTMADGKLPLCIRNARPTADCLFLDVNSSDTLFKVFNYNKFNSVIGAFNLTADKNLSGSVKVSDVDGFSNGMYAVYDTNTQKKYCMEVSGKIDCQLPGIGFDIFTISKITDGFAPIGLINKYNPGGTILDMEKSIDFTVVKVGDAGTFLAFSEKEPQKIFIDEKPSTFVYEDGWLKLFLAEKKISKIQICY